MLLQQVSNSFDTTTAVQLAKLKYYDTTYGMRVLVPVRGRVCVGSYRLITILSLYHHTNLYKVWYMHALHFFCCGLEQLPRTTPLAAPTHTEPHQKNPLLFVPSLARRGFAVFCSFLNPIIIEGMSFLLRLCGCSLFFSLCSVCC